MEKYTLIALLSKNIDNLSYGIKEFPVSRIIIIADKNTIDFYEKAKQGLARFRMPVSIFKITSCDSIGDIFNMISGLHEKYRKDSMIINAASGSQLANSIMICAAFVNGIKAFTIKDNDIISLPVLRHSYNQFITSRKLDIMKVLAKEGSFGSLEELGKKTGMSLPLISYHINGSSKSEGLKQLELIETDKNKGKISVKLNWLGKLLVEDCCR